MASINVGRPGITVTGSGVAVTRHLVFDGVDDQISVPISASIAVLPNGSFTVDLAVEIQSNIEGYLFGNAGEGGQDGFSLYIYDAGIVEALVFRNGLTYEYLSDGAIAIGWHHLELVIDSVAVTAKLYVDGVFHAGDNYSGPLVTTIPADPLLIGSGLYLGDPYPANCKIRWFRISNVARHSTTFTPPSLTVPPSGDSNTVLLLAMEEGAGTTVYDSSGNANNGTITGATWATD